MCKDTRIRIREMALKWELTTIHVCNQSVLMGVKKYILKIILKPGLGVSLFLVMFLQNEFVMQRVYP